MADTNANASIHMAYSVSGKGDDKFYTVTAVVRDKGFRSYNCRTLGRGETLEAAEKDCLDYLLSGYVRQGLRVPASTHRYGKVARVALDALAFINHHEVAQ